MSAAAAATLPKQFLTRIEVQKLLKLRTPRTLDKWERKHKGPPRLNVNGKLILYDYDKLIAWLENQQSTPRPPRKRGRPRKAVAR